MKKLTKKQSLFVQEYLIDLNATRAYKRAGYSVKSDAAAGVEGHKLLKNPKIDAAIKEEMKKRSERTNVTQDQVIQQLAKYAFADIKDLLTWDEETGRISLLSYEEIDGSIITELTQTVTEVPYGEEMVDKVTTKVKRGDPLKALELLGKHLGMFDPKNVNADELSKMQIEKLKADTEFIKVRTQLLKGAKKDTGLLQSLIDAFNGENSK